MTLPMIQEQPGAFGSLVQGAGLGLQQAIPSIQDMIVNKRQQKEKEAEYDEFEKEYEMPGFAKLLKMTGGDFNRANEAYRGLLLNKQAMNPQIGINAAGKEMSPADTLTSLYREGRDKEAKALTPFLLAEHKENLKRGGAKTQEKEETEMGQNSFNRMVELLNEGNLGVGSEIKGRILGGKTAEDVGEFSSLLGSLEAMLVDRVSRGTLSNKRFDYIVETLLPKVTDRQATIRGKMKGLARELGLDPSILQQKGSKKSSSSEDFVMMKDPNGVIRKIPKNKAIEAQRAGGTLVK